MSDDGLRLLTGRDVDPLLRAAVAHRGGELLSWTLEHVDSAPSASTTATYLATVRWPHGERTELLGVEIPTTVLPVSPGRNIAVVVEVAARNFLLKKLGYDTSGHFAKRMESIFEGKK